jgi:CBS domain-containing protein
VGQRRLEHVEPGHELGAIDGRRVLPHRRRPAQPQALDVDRDRDCTRKLVAMARSSQDTLVRDIMSSPVMYVRPDQTDEECMALMTENRLRHLPVMKGGQLIGLVSIRDLVKATISEQQFIIEQLEHYISGQRG